MGLGLQSKVNQANTYLNEIDEQPLSLFELMSKQAEIKESSTKDFVQCEIERDLQFSTSEEGPVINKISTIISVNSTFDVSTTKLYQLLSFDKEEYIIE